jgi:hypothetical protein
MALKARRFYSSLPRAASEVMLWFMERSATEEAPDLLRAATDWLRTLKDLMVYISLMDWLADMLTGLTISSSTFLFSSAFSLANVYILLSYCKNFDSSSSFSRSPSSSIIPLDLSSMLNCVFFLLLISSFLRWLFSYSSFV